MRKLVFALCMIVCLTACKSEQEKSYENIQLLEKELMESYEGMVNVELGKRMIAAYTDYAKKFPSDSLATEMLFKAGEVSQGIGEYEEALQLFDTIFKEHKTSNKAPLALFLIGFITDNHLNSPEAAKAHYQQFINLYPNHQLARDARILIEQAGLDDERLLREFQQ